jgi:phosphonate transport system permease protein
MSGSAQVLHTRPDGVNKAPAPAQWSRFRYPESAIRYGVLVGVLAFVWYSVDFLEIDLERLIGVFPRLSQLLASRYYPPDLGYVVAPDFVWSVVQTLQMSLLGGLFGTLAAIPLAWFAARNVTPGRRSAYPIGRSLIVSSRAIHETIWTVLFVMVLGFGMLSGVLALAMFCIGFAGKLFTDEIEAIDMRPVEALRAVGAGPLQVFQYGVVPQINVAFVGIAIYTWDVAFRAATVVGFFGGGGMGIYLKRTVQSLETHRVAAILLTIVALVTIAEFISGWVRSWIRGAR